MPASSNDAAALGAVRVLLVTDASYADDVLLAKVAAVAAAGLGGALAVQLRDKARPDEALVRLASGLRRVTGDAGALFFVNGRPALAALVGADGVHCGGGGPSVAEVRRALPNALVTVPAHRDEDVAAALAAGAHGALVSPLFRTPGKGPPRGVAALRSARALAGQGFSLFALGGITRENVGAVARAGATGVAVVRALLGAQSPAEEALALRDGQRLPC